MITSAEEALHFQKKKFALNHYDWSKPKEVYEKRDAGERVVVSYNFIALKCIQVLLTLMKFRFILFYFLKFPDI